MKNRIFVASTRSINAHYIFIFEAYLKCPTKCYLRSHGELGTGNAYAEWVQSKNESYRNDAVRRLQENTNQEAECAVIRPLTAENLKSPKWQMGLDFTAQTHNLESNLEAVERIFPEKDGKRTLLIPVRYIFRNKLTKNDKLLLAFDGFVFSEQIGRKIEFGKIIHGDNHSASKVKISGLINTVRKLAERISALLSGNRGTSGI